MNRARNIVNALLEDDEFDPTAEIDRLKPQSSLNVRLEPHEKSTVEKPSWRVYHPLAPSVHLGTVQYAPMELYGGERTPWVGNPESMHHDAKWFATRDEATAYVASLWNIREAEDPSDEIDRLFQDIPGTTVRIAPSSTVENPVLVVSNASGTPIGTVHYDSHADAPTPQAAATWKGFNWMGNPGNPRCEIKGFKTRDEAIRYIAQCMGVKESDDDFDPKEEADRLTGPITQDLLAAWMTEAGFYDFSFYSQHKDGKPYLEVRGHVTAKMLEGIEKLEAFLESKRLHVFNGRVTRQSVNIDHPAQTTKRSIWFLLPLEHIAPDPPLDRPKGRDG